MKFLRWLLSFKKKPYVEVKEPIDNSPQLPPHDYQPRYTLGVIIGHERKAPGAQNILTKEFEYFWNSSLVPMMKSYVIGKNLDLVFIYRDGSSIAGTYQEAKKLKCDAVVELHFNSYNEKSYGTETLCTNRPEDIKFAQAYQKAMCEVFGRNGLSRGVKVMSIKDRGGFSVAQYPEGPNCLVEPAFGSNKDECRLMEENKVAYARCLVDAAVSYFKSLGAN